MKDEERETLRLGFGKLASVAIRAKESKGDAAHLRSLAKEAGAYALALEETLSVIIERDQAMAKTKKTEELEFVNHIDIIALDQKAAVEFARREMNIDMKDIERVEDVGNANRENITREYHEKARLFRLHRKA